MNISIKSPIRFQGAEHVRTVSRRQWEAPNGIAVTAFNQASAKASQFQNEGIPARTFHYEEPGTDSVHIGVVSGEDALPLLLMKRFIDVGIANPESHAYNPRVRQAVDATFKAMDELHSNLRKLAYVQATEQDATRDPQNRLTYARNGASRAKTLAEHHKTCL